MYCSETDSADRPVHTLIIGYGNPMRGDDGAGPALVEALHKRLGDNADRDLEIVSCMQLTPELTHDMSRSQRVIFADASVRIPAGKVTIRRVT
ncbi:hydrogenase maturation protease, partial [mine drainage metagenome]